MIGTVGGGFAVENEELDSAAKNLDQAADDLGAVKDRLSHPLRFMEFEYGEYGVAGAALSFVTSWQDEAQVDIDALRELAGKLRQTSSNYRSNEARTAGSFMVG